MTRRTVLPCYQAGKEVGCRLRLGVRMGDGASVPGWEVDSVDREISISHRVLLVVSSWRESWRGATLSRSAGSSRIGSP